MSRHFICHQQDIKELETKEFTLADVFSPHEPQTVILVRYEDQLYCYHNRCPHLGVPLNWMPDDFLSIEKTHIQCATHGALFNPTDGVCISGPCNGDQLTPLGIECDGDNKIWLKVN